MDSNNIYSAPVLGTAFVKDPNNMIGFEEKITKLYNKLIFKKYGK